MNCAWIAWEDDTSIRSRVLAGELGARYRAVTYFDHSRFFKWLRYPTAAIVTLWLLLRWTPRVLVVQNPSILLAFEAALLRPIFGYRLAIDLHTPFLPTSGLKRRIADFVHWYGLRHSDAVIVTNEALRRRVARQTTVPVFILPDRIPRLGGQVRGGATGDRATVFYVCTFSVDEPWREVLAAAEMVADDITILISGRHRLDPATLPRNVVLTGYLPTEEYHSLLCSAAVVMVLTTAEENLVCGAYEGVAAGKPLVLSDTAALRSYFRRGAVYTRNDAAAIAAAMQRAVRDAAALSADVTRLRGELNREWDAQWAELLAALNGASPRPAETGDDTATARRLPVGG